MNNYYGYNPTNPYLYQQSRYIQPIDQTSQNIQPFNQQPQMINKSTSLLGKTVDSIDVVKAIDIPLDGSISYFPLADGTAIATKQLQQNGISKIIIYKPVEEKEKNTPKYATVEEVDQKIEKIDFSEIEYLKEDMKNLRRDMKEIKNKMKIKDKED